MDAAELARMCPHVPEEVVEAHLRRLPGDYLERFEPARVGRHLEAVAALSDQTPVHVFVDPPQAGDADRAACTVIAFDHPFEFSLIAGCLSGGGFNIEAADVYTLPGAGRDQPAPAGRQVPGRQPLAGARPVPGRSTPGGRRRRDGHREAVIIDRFIGRRLEADDGDFDRWADQLARSIVEILQLLDRRDGDSVQQARRLVNERVTRRLATLARQPLPALLPVELDLQPIDGDMLRLTLASQDTPAFLYALTTALSMRGLSIDRVRIAQDPASGQFTDTIDLVPPRRRDASRAPIDARLIQSIKFSALLTKQFAYYLPRSPDPFTALSRFERLTEDLLAKAEQDPGQWFELLSNPHAMRDLARLLGASDFLWEDFIRGQYESLGPVLTRVAETRPIADPIQTLPRRIEEALAGAVGLAEQQDRLNPFKDREIFRLDLDHILNPAVDFRRFSENLTFLAENLVAAATRLVYEDLVRSYGLPPGASEGRPPYAVFGLGKLGGVALGYASDIELLFVYDAGDSATARTAGGRRKPIAASEFFETLAREASQFIRAKREGIFAVDLRLRPYGSQGPLASSVEAFERYYGGGDPAGGAHPFELLALVRLRWLTGHAELGYRIEKLRDAIVYDQPERWLDLDRLWDTWCRAKREKLTERGRLNAKYSCGALVDLEGAVELLQVRHARRAPQLRTPRISEAMEALHRAGVLDAAEFAAMRAAYDFFRRLINALRMLRGNARDLYLPSADSLELTHLARRMDSTAADRDDRPDDEPAQRLLDAFDAHAKQVQAFFEKHIGRPCPAPHHSIDRLNR